MTKLMEWGSGRVFACAYCGGRGESKPGTNITCIVCLGKGVSSGASP